MFYVSFLLHLLLNWVHIEGDAYFTTWFIYYSIIANFAPPSFDRMKICRFKFIIQSIPKIYSVKTPTLMHQIFFIFQHSSVKSKKHSKSFFIVASPYCISWCLFENCQTISRFATWPPQPTKAYGIGRGKRFDQTSDVRISSQSVVFPWNICFPA